MSANYQNHVNSCILNQLKKRDEIIGNISQLNSGNRNGITFVQDHPKNIKSAALIPAMLKKQWSDLIDLDFRLDEYCQDVGVPNPIKGEA